MDGGGPGYRSISVITFTIQEVDVNMELIRLEQLKDQELTVIYQWNFGLGNSLSSRLLR